MDLSYLQKEILGSPAWMWGAWIGFGAVASVAASYIEKHQDEIGKYVFWKINNLGNRMTGNTLENQLNKK